MCLAACCAASIITAWNHPVRVTPGEATSLATDLPLPTHTVAINTAAAAEFRLLPGIGAVLAGVLLGVMMPYLKTRRRHQMGLKLR